MRAEGATEECRETLTFPACVSWKERPVGPQGVKTHPGHECLQCKAGLLR